MTFFGPDIRNGLPIGLGSVAGFGARGYSPNVLFAAGEQGAWYDPSDLSAMYQDSAGTTPVTAVEQAVGLILDKSKGLVIGPELVVNGNPFDTAGWSIGAGWAISSGVATATNGALLSRTAGLQSGKTYLITVVVSARTSGSLFVSPGGVTYSAAITAAGTYTYRLTQSGGNAFIYFDGGSTFNGTVASLSVRELAGNHAIQPTAASRPILRARYNLLTYSEDLSNAAWNLVGGNCTAAQSTAVAPPSRANALTLLTATAGDGSRLHTGATVVAGQQVVASYCIKAATGTAAQLRLSDGVTGQALVTINTATGAVTAISGAVYGTVTATSTALGDGWFLYTVTGTQPSGQTNAKPGVYITNSGDALYATAFDLRRSSDTYLPYQRIAAATDYDTVGFPVYLSCDGSDDGMYTSSIDFSATDKMTVWAGVTKLSDAAVATVAEFGLTGSDLGSFGVFAPRTAATKNFGYHLQGSTETQGQSGAVDAPITAVLTVNYDIAKASGSEIAARLNGADQSLTFTGDSGTGNFGNLPLYVGRRTNNALPFNGRLYQLIVRGAATSAALITQAERWVAGKQGRTL